MRLFWLLIFGAGCFTLGHWIGFERGWMLMYHSYMEHLEICHPEWKRLGSLRRRDDQ